MSRGELPAAVPIVAGLMLLALAGPFVASWLWSRRRR